jgi:hypothetical protein
MTLKPKAFFNIYRYDLIALAFFCVLLVIYSWPLLTNLNNVLIGADNDVFINPWADWWTAKALREPQYQLWHTDYLFYPQGADLIYHSFSHLNTAVSLLLQSFMGPIPAYNLTILFNYLLTSLAAFQFTRYLTGSVIAGLLAGVIFAFNTHYIYQSAHPVLVSIWCIPWFSLYLMRAIRENKIRYALIAAIFYFLAACVSILLLIILSLWAAVFTLHLFFSSGRATFPYRLFLIFSFVSFILIFPLIYPLLKETISQGQSDFIITARSSLPSDIATFITPPWIRWEPRGVYLGLPILFLLLITRPKAGWWWAALIISCLIVIGPYPIWAGEPLTITLPWSLPIVSLLRHAHRLNILVSFSLAVLAGYSWVELAQYLRRRSLQPTVVTLIGLLFILLVYIDYTPHPFPRVGAQVSAFYTDFLAEVPNEVALATIPFGRQEDKHYLFYQTFHQHPITGGVVSRPLPGTYSFIEGNPILQAGTIEDAPISIPIVAQELSSLAEQNIGYLVIHKNLMLETQVAAWRAALPMLPVYEDDLLIAYATTPTN